MNTNKVGSSCRTDDDQGILVENQLNQEESYIDDEQLTPRQREVLRVLDEILAYDSSAWRTPRSLRAAEEILVLQGRLPKRKQSPL